MNDLTPAERIAALKAQSEAITAQIKVLKAEDRKRRNDAVAIALTLTPANQNVLAAKKDYEEKGFFVDIVTDEKTGLIIKWKLRNRRPRKQGIGGTSSSQSSAKQLRFDEFKQILPSLANIFSSKDLKSALIESNIGERNLQPAFGKILKGTFGPPGIEKVPGSDQGPGVRYRKVN
jgi:hypothetical protein